MVVLPTVFMIGFKTRFGPVWHNFLIFFHNDQTKLVKAIAFECVELPVVSTPMLGNVKTDILCFFLISAFF